MLCLKLTRVTHLFNLMPEATTVNTADINGNREAIDYKTNTGMYTRLTSPYGLLGQYGADVYSTKDKKFIVLVATSHNGSTLVKFRKVITAEEYHSILELHDPYDDFPYHAEIMKQLRFT